MSVIFAVIGLFILVLLIWTVLFLFIHSKFKTKTKEYVFITIYFNIFLWLMFFTVVFSRWLIREFDDTATNKTILEKYDDKNDNYLNDVRVNIVENEKDTGLFYVRIENYGLYHDTWELNIKPSKPALPDLAGLNETKLNKEEKKQ